MAPPGGLWKGEFELSTVENGWIAQPMAGVNCSSGEPFTPRLLFTALVQTEIKTYTHSDSFSGVTFLKHPTKVY